MFNITETLEDANLLIGTENAEAGVDSENEVSLDFSIEEMSEQMDLDDTLAEVDSLCDTLLKLYTVMDDSETACAVLNEHGFSKPIMQILDSSGSFSKALADRNVEVPGLESLSEVPEKTAASEDSIVGLEALKEDAKKMAKAVWERLKIMFARLFEFVFNRTQSFKKKLEAAQEKLNKATINEEKLKEVEVNALGRSGLETVIKDISAIAKSISAHSPKKLEGAQIAIQALAKDIKSHGNSVGFGVTEDARVSSKRNMSFFSKVSKLPLAKHGYTGGTVKTLVTDAKTMLNDIEAIKKVSNDINKVIAEGMAAANKANADIENDDARGRDKKINSATKSLLEEYRVVITHTVSAAVNAANLTLVVANGVLRCTKASEADASKEKEKPENDEK